MRLASSGVVCLIAAFLLTGGLPAAGQIPPGLSSDLLITLHRDACEARCAVYTVSIGADGSVRFDGQHYVRVRGRASARVARQAVQALAQRFDAIGFFALDGEYTPKQPDRCVMARGNAPRATITLRQDGRSKTVVHDHRCGGPMPAALRDLEDAIDRTAGVARWIR